MKKKILSAEALALIAGQQAAAPVMEGVTAEAETNENIPEVPETEAKAETPEETINPLAAELEAANTGLEAMKSVVEVLEAKVADLEISLVAEKAHVKAASETANDFKDIVAGLTGNMRIAMGLTHVDMSNWTGEALLREYQAISESFEKSLPVGGVVPETKAEVKKPTMTNLDAGAIAALGFK